MILTNFIPWETIGAVASLIATVLIFIIAVTLFLTVRNFHHGKMKIQGDFLRNIEQDQIRISFFNVGKFDTNLFSAGLIVNKNTIECVERMTQGNMKYVPCLSKSFCSFTMTSDECIKLIKNCVGSLENKKIKVSLFSMDTYGNKKVVKNKTFVKLFKQSLSVQQVIPSSTSDDVIDSEPE